MRSKLIAGVVLLAGVALGFTLARAGGSFFTGEALIPVLKQQPELAKFLTETLDLSNSGGAGRIGTSVSEALGGRRVGPYELYAKPKGAKGPYCFAITVETDLKFFGKDGKLMPQEKGARGAESCQEKLKSVTFTVLDSSERKLSAHIPVWTGQEFK